MHWGREINAHPQYIQTLQGGVLISSKGAQQIETLWMSDKQGLV